MFLKSGGAEIGCLRFCVKGLVSALRIFCFSARRPLFRRARRPCGGGRGRGCRPAVLPAWIFFTAHRELFFRDEQDEELFGSGHRYDAPSSTSPIGPPAAALGGRCPMAAPENLPSVISAVLPHYRVGRREHLAHPRAFLRPLVAAVVYFVGHGRWAGPFFLSCVCRFCCALAYCRGLWYYLAVDKYQWVLSRGCPSRLPMFSVVRLAPRRYF